MTLTETYLNLFTKGTANENQTQTKQGASSIADRNASFQSYLETAGGTGKKGGKAEANDYTFEKKTDNNYKNTSNVKPSTRDNKTNASTSSDVKRPVSNSEAGKSSDDGKNISTEQPKTDDVKTDTATTSDSKVSGENTDEVSNEKTGELTEAEDAMAGDIAKELGISKDAVMQILAQLNMTPLELAEPENMSLFIQKLYNVESKLELLSIPNVQDTLKALQNIVEQYTDGTQLSGKMAEVSDELVVVNTDDKPAKKKEAPVSKMNNDVTAEDTEMAETMQTVIEVSEEGMQEQGQETDMGAETDVAEQAVIDIDAEVPQTSGFSQTLTEKTKAVQNQSNPVAATNEAEVSAETPEGIAINPALLSNNSSRAAETSAVRTEAARNVNTQDIINQIVERMKVEIKADTTSEIKITLRPEHLGDVTMKIMTQNGIVTAQFVAENQRIREVIEAGFAQLRQALEEQGVSISQLSVSVGQNGGDNELSGNSSRHFGASGIIQGEQADGIGIDGGEAQQNSILDGYTVDYKI